MKKYSITVIISHENLVVFQEQVEKHCENKKIILKKYGATTIPVQIPGGQALMSVPHCIIEHECTETEYNSWKFQTKTLAQS